MDGTVLHEVGSLENPLKSLSSHSEATSSEAQSNGTEGVDCLKDCKLNHDLMRKAKLRTRADGIREEKRYVYGCLCCRKNFACIFNTFNCAHRF